MMTWPARWTSAGTIHCGHCQAGVLSSQLFIMDSDTYFCRRMEAAGASFITVHGRTREQRGQPVNLEAIRTIKQVVSYLFLTFDDNEAKKY